MAGFLRRLGRGFNWLGLGVIVALVVIWQILVSTKVVSYDSLPGPKDIWGGLQDLLGPDGGFGAAVAHTVQVALLSWLIGTVIGGVVGLLIGMNQTVASWGNSTVDLLRSLPVVALIPIAILIWGTGDETEIILGAYAALWPMLINTVGGIRAVTPRLRDVAKTLNLSRRATVTKIILPATGSSMLVGARLALASSLVICVVSEMLGLQSGVGNQLVLEQSAQQPARMWVYVLTAGVLGVIVNAGMIKLFQLLLPGVAAVAERNSGR